MGLMGDMKKKFFNNRILFFFFFISLILNFFLIFQNIKYQQQNQVKVIGVIDGDTLVLENKTRLRLRHIDAPEIEFCGGKEAKEYLENLVKGKKITIAEAISDQKGRMMALVYLNNQLINQLLLEKGLVRYHSDQTSKTEVLKKIALAAKNKKLGIYSEKCRQMENKDNPKCNIKGNFEDKKSNKKLYYLVSCAQYKYVIVEKDLGEQWFCDEKEAIKAGYKKAKTCQ